MAKIIGSCGHEIKAGHENCIAVKSIDRQGRRCVSHLTVCSWCKFRARMAGVILKNKKAEYRWLEFAEPGGMVW